MGKRKLVKRGSTVICRGKEEGFTIGKSYMVKGHAPKYRLILKDDKGKTAFPLAKNFRTLSLLEKVKRFLNIK